MNAAAKILGISPGPWYVERPYGEPGVYIADRNTGLVAKLYNPDNPATIEANGAAIREVPEMIAELRATGAELRLMANAMAQTAPILAADMHKRIVRIDTILSRINSELETGTV